MFVSSIVMIWGPGSIGKRSGELGICPVVVVVDMGMGIWFSTVEALVPEFVEPDEVGFPADGLVILELPGVSAFAV
jgi:hypothetical protein